MSTTFPDDEPPRIEQHNHGPGPFIGRDNYGTINNAIDETTKKVLRKLSHEAPALADLLEQALQDGIVSPDAAYALEYAARNINQDVAESLAIAGRNINEDVATSLSCAAESLKDSLEKINAAPFGFDMMPAPNDSYDLTDKLSAAASDIKSHISRTSLSLQVQRQVDWRPTFWAFFVGLAIGMIIIGVFWIKS